MAEQNLPTPAEPTKAEIIEALRLCVDVIYGSLDRDDSGVMEAVCAAEDVLEKLGHRACADCGEPMEPEAEKYCLQCALGSTEG